MILKICILPPFGQQLYFEAIKRLLTADLNGPAPKRLVSVKLPPAADPLNYENGAYGDVHQAVDKKGFTVVESWEPADKVGTRAGFVKVPMLVSDTTLSTVEFPFNGRTIGISIVSGPDAGVISYSIDGGAVQQKDLRTQWSKSLYLPWFLILGDGLKAGQHTLKLIKPADASVCRVVHFLVNK